MADFRSLGNDETREGMRNAGKPDQKAKDKQGLYTGETGGRQERVLSGRRKWESGEAIPELERLLQLADTFQATLDEMVRGERYYTGEPAKPYRDPVFLRDDRYAYHNAADGELGRFNGMESIFCNGEPMVECRYQGGSVSASRKRNRPVGTR